MVIVIVITREGWCVRCACLSRPSGRVGSNDPLSLSSTESTPTSHEKSQRPSNPNRFPMCATVAIETRIDQQIARQLEPQIDIEIDLNFDLVSNMAVANNCFKIVTFKIGPDKPDPRSDS